MPPASHLQQQQQQIQQQGSLISLTTNLEVLTRSSEELVNQENLGFGLQEPVIQVVPAIDLNAPVTAVNLIVASTSSQEVSNSIQMETKHTR